MHSAFSSAGRTAVTGASTVPALSSAVVDALCSGWRSIHTIDTCIAPAQRAPRGEATLAAVLSYCGVPIPVWENGQWQRAWDGLIPLQLLQRLRPRRGAVCDIPDLARRFHLTTKSRNA